MGLGYISVKQQTAFLRATDRSFQIQTGTRNLSNMFPDMSPGRRYICRDTHIPDIEGAFEPKHTLHPHYISAGDYSAGCSVNEMMHCGKFGKVAILVSQGEVLFQ